MGCCLIDDLENFSDSTPSSPLPWEVPEADEPDEEECDYMDDAPTGATDVRIGPKATSDGVWTICKEWKSTGFVGDISGKVRFVDNCDTNNVMAMFQNLDAAQTYSLSMHEIDSTMDAASC